MDTPVRFLLDENINYPDTIVAVCAEFGVEAVTVFDVGLVATHDHIIFSWAMGKGYAIVTNNIYEFRPMHADWLQGGKASPGLVLVPNAWKRRPYQIAEALINMATYYVPNREWWVGGSA